jgi:cytochrome c oxidase subunit 1
MAHTETAHGDNYLNHGKGIWSWMTTLDHKRIGVMYLFTVLSFFLVGGIFALLVRLELFSPGQTIMDANTYNKMFTYHGAIMVFLVVIPAIPGALGNFVLPILLGAKDVAFPRLNLASYYIYVAGALICRTPSHCAISPVGATASLMRSGIKRNSSEVSSAPALRPIANPAPVL